MATKSITITNEAYERLASYKGENESFSDVVNKLTKKSSILDLVGLISNKDAEDIKDWRKKMNEEMQKRLDKTAKQLQ